MKSSQVEPRRKWRTVILIVALVALAATAVVSAWRNRDERQPDTPESAISYICLECKHVFKMTPADYERISKDGGVKAPADAQTGGMVQFRCPSCKKLASVQAVACPNDGTMIPRRLPDRKPGRCPKCNWSFYLR